MNPICYKKPTYCFVTTVSVSIRAFCLVTIARLQEAGFEVTVVCATDDTLQKDLPPGTVYMPIFMSRRGSPLKDLKTLWQLYRLFRRNRFDIIQYSTPKASLLASIAAWAAGLPRRLHLQWGLVYTGQTGWQRKLLKFLESIPCKLSNQILPITPSLAEFLGKERLAMISKMHVIGYGSACGIDTTQINPEVLAPHRARIREYYGIPHNALVIGTVARLTRDKGINELVAAFEELAKAFPHLYLLLVGSEEQADPLSDATHSVIANHPRVISAGMQIPAYPYYSAMDIFCLPTYREGFGEVNMEAQAMGLPVVSTDIVGPKDCVIHEKTGILVPPRNAQAIQEALHKLIQSPEKAKAMGHQGRSHVAEKFEQKILLPQIVAHRLSMLAQESSK